MAKISARISFTSIALALFVERPVIVFIAGVLDDHASL